MKYILLIVAGLLSCGISPSVAQEYQGKFEQLDADLPTPNEYRSGSGAPGYKYWQQQADYKIQVALDDDNQSVTGSETITYYNNSPDPLSYLWLQLDQNMRAKDSMTPQVQTSAIKDSINARFFQRNVVVDDGFDGGFNIISVTDTKDAALTYLINKTMMKVQLPEPLPPGEQYSFKVAWSYNINDRMMDNGRSGYEYFPEDGNYVYTIAQFYPRMAVYNDLDGWQNKQFLGQGEFALTFGDFEVAITVPDDHIVAATGEIQNEKEVLSPQQRQRMAEARSAFDKPVMIVTEKEATENEKVKSTGTRTWRFKAKQVRDFAFATSRKFIWDAMAVKLNEKEPLAMSFYPKEGNPLWEKESTRAVKNTLISYSQRTFDYPYPVAISVHAASIGMEYPMICFNFGRPAPNGSYSDNTKWGMISVIIHEVGHNYFPMIVNSDERQWTWMDEGLNTFLENLTSQEYYPKMPVRFGVPETIGEYMAGDKNFIRPIMTNSEQIVQFGYNAYAKPSAALYVLRNTIMGSELFDAAFREYAQRWKFKQPGPADFFRTMEDASAVDLDWFWRGWFYTTDYVDVAVDDVKWYRVANPELGIENSVSAQPGNIGQSEPSNDVPEAKNWPDAPQALTITDTDRRYFGEFRNRTSDDEIRRKYGDKNLYEVTFTNDGGLVTPLLIEFTYADGSTETEQIPAEIWRMNENRVTKVFVKDREVTKITLDPDRRTGDAHTANNMFPRTEQRSRFELFRNKAREE